MCEALETKEVAFTILAWTDLLSSPSILEEVLEENCVIKIDSYGENFKVFRQLLERGAQEMKQDSEKEFQSLSAEKVRLWQQDFGRIQYSRQAFVGFRSILIQIEKTCENVRGVRFINSPKAIIQMFDKLSSHRLLEEKQVSKTQLIGNIKGYDDLQIKMKASSAYQVFVKLAHGSSSSGVMAYRRNRHKEILKTSIEFKRTGTKISFYNSLKIRSYTDTEEIRLMVDYMARENLLAEKWESKASFDCKNFDLRLVVIDGKVGHVVMRCSSSPMTNLHLGNERGDLLALKIQIGNKFWGEIEQLAIDAVAAYEDVLVAGVDILITSNYKSAKVIEVNAFGDLLPNILNEARRTTYEEQAELMICLCYES